MGYIKNNQLGVTLIELLIAIAIIGIMTSIAVVRISLTDAEVLRQATEQTAADFRQIRNLASSRVINENNQYPDGGYGIFFANKTVDDPAYYVLFAENNGHNGYQDYSCRVGSCPEHCNGYCDADPDTFIADAMIKKYIYDENLTVYMDNSPATPLFFYTFSTEHIATTTYSHSVSSIFAVNIHNTNGDDGLISVQDKVDDTYVFGSINVTYP